MVDLLTKSTLASGSYDKTIRVWNFESGECLKVLKGHTGGVTSLCISPSNGYLCSGSDDKSIIVWK